MVEGGDYGLSRLASELGQTFKMEGDVVIGQGDIIRSDNSASEFPDMAKTFSDLLPCPPLHSYLEESQTKLQREAVLYKILKRFSIIYGELLAEKHERFHMVKVLCIDFEEKFDDLNVVVLLPMKELRNPRSGIYIKTALFGSNMEKNLMIVTIKDKYLPQELQPAKLGPIEWNDLPSHYRLMVDRPCLPLQDYADRVSGIGLDDIEKIVVALGIDPKCSVDGKQLPPESFASHIRRDQERNLYHIHQSRGMKYIDEFEFIKAEAEFREALRHDSGNIEGLFNLGLTYYLTGKLGEAIENLKAARDLDPNMQDVNKYLIKSIEKFLESDAAIDEKLKQAMVLAGLKPDDPEVQKCVAKLAVETHFSLYIGPLWLTNLVENSDWEYPVRDAEQTSEAIQLPTQASSPRDMLEDVRPRTSSRLEKAKKRKPEWSDKVRRYVPSRRPASAVSIRSKRCCIPRSPEHTRHTSHWSAEEELSPVSPRKITKRFDPECVDCIYEASIQKKKKHLKKHVEHLSHSRERRHRHCASSPRSHSQNN